MNFLHPLWLLLLPALLLAYAWLRVSSTGDDWAKVVHPQLLRWYQSSDKNKGKRITSLLLATLVALALASPSLPSSRDSEKHEQAFAHAEGWLIIIDVSKSVTLTDIAPNRLHIMREAAKYISQQAGATPVGLIVYAGDAFLVAPPAIDKQFLEEKLSLIEYGLISAEGSNPTRALGLANSVIESAGFITARTFLLSDGGGLTSKTTPAIASLARAGHRLDLLVIGEDTPAGEVSSSKQDLQRLADTGQGKLLYSDALGNIPLPSLQLNRAISTSALIERGGISTLRHSNQSHWLLLLAIPLCLWMFTRERSR